MKDFKIEVQKDQLIDNLVEHFIDEFGLSIVKRKEEEFVKERKKLMEKGNRLVLFVSGEFSLSRSYSFTLKAYQNQSHIGNVFKLKGTKDRIFKFIVDSDLKKDLLLNLF